MRSFLMILTGLALGGGWALAAPSFMPLSPANASFGWGIMYVMPMCALAGAFVGFLTARGKRIVVRMLVAAIGFGVGLGAARFASQTYLSPQSAMALMPFAGAFISLVVHSVLRLFFGIGRLATRSA